MAKPSILFLHGSGTNAEIFRLQTRKLAHLLQPHFTLLYPTAPLPSKPGPGVLPFFEECGPFATWMDDTSAATEDPYWGADHSDDSSGVSALLASIERLVRDEGAGPVVGVVGFSMGAQVGMEVSRRMGEAVRVVVSVCGTVPYRGGGDAAREEGFRRMVERGRVRAESVQIIGETDPWRGQSEKLVGFFEEDGRRVIRFRGGHMMPADDAINKQVVKVMLAACSGV
ncbi:serine hydrolase FSH [Chaetomium fimeti]|uniref:Serine hydrolase FSH n=1 Tax=Chaetomium fimeti TaxID=1854472 RepID=A0AAE0LS07_9PEZI|nr:serine hydrolase FSH [Chaetomium fimeti]